MSYSYQWERCDASGANCVDIAGATSYVYTLTSDDLGKTIRVRVTDTQATHESPQTIVITPHTTATFNVAVTDHTLPTYYAGLGFAYYRAQNDMPQSGYRAALDSINPEVYRYNGWHSPGTIASPNPNWLAMKNLAIHAGSNVGVIMGPTGARPAGGQPSANAANDPSNIEGPGGGRSPQEAADWFENWHNAGINILGMEFYNEPDNCAGTTAGDGPWYGASGNATQTDRNKCETWAYVHQRQYKAAVDAKAAAMAVSPPRYGGHVVGGAPPYAQGWSKKFVSGQTLDGSSWPYGDSNFPYFDTLAFHPYQGNASTQQGRLNGIYWDPASFVNSGDSVATKSYLHNLHSYMAAQGHPEKKLAYNECGDPSAGAYAGVIDVAQAILAYGWMSVYNIDYFTLWSGNASADNQDWPPMSTSYVINTRGCTQRDMVFKFSRNYKKIVGFGQFGSLTPASGEINGSNNSVPALPWVAGVNAGSNKLGILVCNLHLSSSQSFSVTWSNGNPTGAATYTQLLQSTTVSGSTPLPSGTMTLSGGALSRTIEPGAAYLFEVPF